MTRRVVRAVIDGFRRHQDASPIEVAASVEAKHEAAAAQDPPFSTRGQLDADELTRRTAAIAAAGVRLFPYPFASAMAFVSDCDRATRTDVLSIRRQLVDEFGLDFGDSCHIMHRSTLSRWPEGPCFMRFDGALVPEEETGPDTDEAMEFHELLREAHRGNVDHYHFFSGSGPRMIYLRPANRSRDRRCRIDVPEEIETRSDRQKGNPGNFNFRGEWMPALVVAVQPIGGPLPEGTTFSAVMRSERDERIAYERTPWGGGAWRPRLSRTGPDPACFRVVEDAACRRAFVDSIAAFEIVQPEGIDPVAIESVFLINVDRPMLAKMVALMHDRYGFRPGLITDHGSRFLVHASSEARHTEANTNRAFETPPGALSCVIDRDDLRCSALGDDPASFAYLLPELRGDAGVRFVNAGGGSCEVGRAIDLLNAVVPVTARDGSRVYVARRTTAVLPDRDGAAHPLASDQGTRSFPLRLSLLLDEQRERPGTVFPMYTHLGNVWPKEDRTTPYFPPQTLARLQDRVFDVSGTTPADSRIWFTRASVLYDYALMMRSIADHVRRDDANTILLSSWDDPVLGATLPRAPSQLHGVTFHVDDAVRATVALDGAPIETVVRNEPDETGRPSVTIVGVGPSHVVLDDVDHVGGDGFESTGGLAYEWCDDPARAYRGRAFAALTRASAGHGRITWRPKDLHPRGAQFLGYAVRRSHPEARFSVLLETETGGVFSFGDEIDGSDRADVDACYALANDGAADWTYCVVPFHALGWRRGATPGGPLPSHRIRAISFVVDGPAGCVVSIDRMEFFRPATTPPLAPDGTCVVGGVVRAATPGTTVTLSYEHDGRPVSRTETVRERRGGFGFPGVPPGSIVEVEASVDGRVVAPRRGRRFDVWSHDMEVVIDPR